MRILIPLLIAGAPMAAADDAPPFPLAAHRWHDRVLIVFAPAGADPRRVAQDRLLAADPAGLRDRDLLVVRVTGDDVAGLADRASALRRAYAVPASDFAVRLVGKDGTLALARGAPISAADLFATIDAMPMRRDEVRRRR